MVLSVTQTWIFLAVALLGAVGAWYQTNRQRPLGEVSVLPWNQILILCVVAAVLMAVHLVNLAGIETGRNP